MTILRSALLSAFAAVLACGAALPANAQRYDNRYDRYDRYDNDNDRDGSRGGRNVAGQFDYYALVLSWSPTHCASTERNDETQCNRRDGRRYNFVLHGLWPQYERGFPGDCDTGRGSYVPDRVIDDVMDIMPSKPLIIHEYRKHGTCSGLEPSRYFELGEKLFRSIKIPERYVNPFEEQRVATEALVDEFLALNKQLSRDQIVVACDGSRNRLKEVRVCMTRDGQPRSCGRNETQRKLCSASTIYVPPVRSSAEARTDVPSGRDTNRNDNRDRAPNVAPRPDNDNPLPGPRMDRYRDERSL